MRVLPLLLLLLLASCLDPGEPGNLVPRTVTEDAALPRLAINGTVLHAEAFGDPANPVVVVLHGGPGEDYRSLLPLQALAADGYYVVFWDQRGCGLSQRHDASIYSFALLLEDLEQVVDHYAPGARPLVFIGHSWGAMYATSFINEHGSYGGRIRGAVLSEPGAFTKAQLDAFLRRLMGSYDLFGEQLNDIAWSGQFMSADDHARADYLMMIQSANGAPAEHLDPANPEPRFRSGAVVHRALLELAEKEGFDWTTHLSSFEPTVLFLRGDLNEAANLASQQEMASSYRHAEIVTIHGVGHSMVWERPAEYVQDVRDYFARIGFAGGGR
ncbi:MAG TPA: alpha/beta hydrolase [Myxococcales bacterium]|nr:alpha/beta hydrolase [Myxococcales bacterium]